MFNKSKARLSAIMALTVSANLLAQPTLVSAEEVEVDTLTTNQKEVPLVEQLPTTAKKVEVAATVTELPIDSQSVATTDTITNALPIEAGTDLSDASINDVTNETTNVAINEATDEATSVATINEATNPAQILEHKADSELLTKEANSQVEFATNEEALLNTLTNSSTTENTEGNQTTVPTHANRANIPLAELTYGETGVVENTPPSNEDSELIMDASVITPIMASPTVVAATPDSITAQAQDFIMPAYRYADPNSSYWSNITALGGDQIPYVIINPSNGSGSQRIENFSQQLATNSAAGIKSLGYVNTKGFSRSQSDVLAEVERYITFYGADQINGIFFDVTKPGETAAETAYMADLYNYVKNRYPHMTVMGNPGRTVTNSISPYADIWLTRETTADDYLNGYYEQISDMEKDPASSKRVMHLVHSASPSDYDRIIALSRQRNAGYLMVTDRSFLELPSDFTNLVNKINAGGNTKTPSVPTEPAKPLVTNPVTPETQPQVAETTPTTSNNRGISSKNEQSALATATNPTNTATANNVIVRPLPSSEAVNKTSASNTATASAPHTTTQPSSSTGQPAVTNRIVAQANDTTAAPNTGNASSYSASALASPTSAVSTSSADSVNGNTTTATSTPASANSSATTTETKPVTSQTPSTSTGKQNPAAKTTTPSTPTAPATVQPAVKETTADTSNLLSNPLGAVAAIGGLGIVGAGAYVVAKKKKS